MRRRWLLALTAYGGAVRASQPDTPSKLSQTDAAYQDHPRGGLSCVGCTFFRRPRACQVVAGDVSPDGWCRLFDLPD
jgi:hypothetical protein